METMTVSQVAKRLGLSAGAVRLIPETELAVMRTSGNQRRYKRSVVEIYEAAYEAPATLPFVTEWYPEKDVAEFVAFMERVYAENEEISLDDSRMLFDKYGVGRLLADHYGALHTQGELYVLGDIYSYFDKLGISHKFDASKNVDFDSPDLQFGAVYN